MSIIRSYCRVWMIFLSFFTMRTGWELLASGDKAFPSVWHWFGSSLRFSVSSAVPCALCILLPHFPLQSLACCVLAAILMFPLQVLDIPLSGSLQSILILPPILFATHCLGLMLAFWHQRWFCSCSVPEHKLGQITLLTECMRSVGSRKIWRHF